MSISLPTNKAEKLARYNMLVKQGSMTIEQAKQAYKEYLERTKLPREPCMIALLLERAKLWSDSDNQK